MKQDGGTQLRALWKQPQTSHDHITGFAHYKNKVAMWMILENNPDCWCGSIYQEDLVLLRIEMSNGLFTSQHLQDNFRLQSIFFFFFPPPLFLAQAPLMDLRREFKRGDLFQRKIIEKVDELALDLPFLRGYQTGQRISSPACPPLSQH